MRHFRPCPHVAAGIFENGDFFSVFKKICVHTQRFRIVCAEERALNLGMTSSYLKTSVFARLHEYVASNAAALFPFPREGTRSEGNKAAALEATGIR